MKKIKTLLVFASIASAVGVLYALYTLKGMPDIFDLEDCDEDF